MILKHLSIVGLLAAAVACGDDDSSEALAGAVTAVTLTAGPVWDPALPPEQQDLAAHNEFLVERFAAGELVANGPLSSGLGLYLYAVDDVGPILDLDPGLTSGVLARLDLRAWAIEADRLDAARDDLPWFLLEAPLGGGASDFNRWLQNSQLQEGLRLSGRDVELAHVLVQTTDAVEAQSIADLHPEPAVVAVTAWFPQRMRGVEASRSRQR